MTLTARPEAHCRSYVAGVLGLEDASAGSGTELVGTHHAPGELVAIVVIAPAQDRVHNIHEHLLQPVRPAGQVVDGAPAGRLHRRARRWHRVSRPLVVDGSHRVRRCDGSIQLPSTETTDPNIEHMKVLGRFKIL